MRKKTAECRHTPVGNSTRLVDRFRYWFIFTDYRSWSFPYTVGMVKCAKCGAVLRIPELYYSLSFNLLYMVCYALLGWGSLEFLAVLARHWNHTFLLAACYLVILLLIYFLVDRIFWFAVMHLCKWDSMVIEPENHKLVIQRESKRFLHDRRIKIGMYLLGLGLGSYMFGTPPGWFASYLTGIAAGLLILIFMQVIAKHRLKKQV